jgi:transcription initiation factor TFIIIB Brf1 subunit/transcription initiation factor TFIIB
MSLFHYYTYHKSFREFDRAQLVVACVFLGCKLHSIFLNIEEAQKEYNEIKSGGSATNGIYMQTFDVVKYEVELLNILGFDLEIPTPYGYIMDIAKKMGLSDTTTNVAFNIASDSYRRPLGIYYTPKQVSLACIYIAINMTQEHEFMIDRLPCVEIHNKIEVCGCIDFLLLLFEDRLKISK